MVSERDRAKMRRVAQDLADGESNDRGTPQQRAAILAFINHGREQDGRPALVDRPPEEGFYERARSLGMARIDR